MLEVERTSDTSSTNTDVVLGIIFRLVRYIRITNDMCVANRARSSSTLSAQSHPESAEFHSDRGERQPAVFRPVHHR